MSARKIPDLEQIIGHELKLLAKIEANTATTEDLNNLRHYEAKRKRALEYTAILDKIAWYMEKHNQD